MFSGPVATRLWCGAIVLALLSALALAPAVVAQVGPKVDPAELAKQDLADGGGDGPAPPAANQPPPAIPEKDFNLLKLFFEGGPMMYPIVIPIALFSLLVLVFGFERMLAIRRSKVIPEELVQELGQTFNINETLGEDDLKKAYRSCNMYPSAAAKVIKVALLKASRPHSEVEHAVKDASEREAERLYVNVRPLNLAAAVTPLLGLLGTVLGMIMAFYQTASGSVVANKAEQLAQGIYTALVTTFAGLAVAIPAAVLAHWFEGRIQNLFREIDELLLAMLPALEQFENKLEIRRKITGPPPQPSAPPKPRGTPSKPYPPRPDDREEQRGI